MNTFEKFINWCEAYNGFLSVVLSITTIIISVVAIFISLASAKNQNKIALFDTRYEVYQQIVLIKDFIESYYETMDLMENNGVSVNPEEYYISLWEGEIRPYTFESTSENAIINKQKSTIHQAEFLFNGLSKNDFEKLENYISCYSAMSQQYIVLPKGNLYVGDITNDDYKKTFQENDIKGVIKKLESELKLK